MIPAALVPYALVLVGGMAIGAAGVGWVQQVRIDALKVSIRETTVVAQEARQRAQRAADEASATIAGLSSDLATSHRHQRVIRVQTVREIERATRPDRECLSPAAVRVLRDAEARRATENPGAGQSAGAGPGAAPDPGRSASERAVAVWMQACRSAYWELRDRDETKSTIIRELERAGVVEIYHQP